MAQLLEFLGHQCSRSSTLLSNNFDLSVTDMSYEIETRVWRISLVALITTNMNQRQPLNYRL